MIDHDAVWLYVPKLSKAEALTLMGFSRLWDFQNEPAEGGSIDRLEPEPVSVVCGVASATVGAVLRKFTTGGDPVGVPPLFEPDYYLAPAEGRTVPDRRVGYRPAAAILVRQPAASLRDDRTDAELTVDVGVTPPPS